MTGRAAALALVAMLACPGASDAHPSVVAKPGTHVEMAWATAPEAPPPRVVPLARDAPAGFRPPPGARDPRYARVPLGDAQLAIAVDVAAGSEQIWIDHDLDGDAANDPAPRWSRRAAGWERAVRVVVPFADGELPARFSVRVSLAGGGNTLLLSVAAARAGRAVLGGRARDVLLVDVDHDLAFDLDGADRLLVDVDGDGQLETRPASRDDVGAGGPFRIGDDGFTAHVLTRSGGAIEFRRAPPPPRSPRAWEDVPAPPSGRAQEPPAESLAKLLRRFAAPARDRAAREEIVRKIGRVGTDKAFDALLHLAREDSDRRLRRVAVRAMGNPRFRARVPAVVALTDPEVAGIEAATAAVEALHTMGAPDRERVYVDLVERGIWMVSGTAAQHLAYLPGETARTTAVEHCALLHSRSSRAPPYPERYRAYLGVRTFRGGPPSDVMLSAAQSPYPPLRALGLRDMFSVGHPALRAIALRAANHRSIIWIRSARATEPDEFQDFQAEVRHGQRDLGDALIRILGSFDDPAATARLAGIAQGVPLARRDALVRQLGARRRAPSVAAVLSGLTSREAEVRDVCARALLEIPGQRVTRALARQLRKERNDDTAATLYDVVGRRRDALGLDAALLGCDDRDLRGPALAAAVRIAPRDQRVAQRLDAALAAPDAAERVRGLLAVETSGDDRLARRAVAQLEHESWSVRVAAIDVLRTLRRREWVDPLIEALDGEPRMRLRRLLGMTLFELTGQDLGDDAAPWRVWFRDHGATFEVPHPRPLRATSLAGSTASFFGIPIDSDHAAFVLDRSGSMAAAMDGHTTDAAQGRTRVRASAEAAVAALRGMENDAEVNLLLFYSEVRAWKSRLVPLSAKNRKTFERRLRSQFLGVGTNVYRALRRALSDENADTILLLTDGLPTDAPYDDPARLLAVVRRLNESRRAAIHCVSLGRDSELLRRLAAENDGRYIRR